MLTRTFSIVLWLSRVVLTLGTEIVSCPKISAADVPATQKSREMYWIMDWREIVPLAEIRETQDLKNAELSQNQQRRILKAHAPVWAVVVWGWGLWYLEYTAGSEVLCPSCPLSWLQLLACRADGAATVTTLRSSDRGLFCKHRSVHLTNDKGWVNRQRSTLRLSWLPVKVI